MRYSYIESNQSQTTLYDMVFIHTYIHLLNTPDGSNT